MSGQLTPRDELMILVGRLDALAELHHAVGELVQEMDSLDFAGGEFAPAGLAPAGIG